VSIHYSERKYSERKYSERKYSERKYSERNIRKYSKQIEMNEHGLYLLSILL